MNFNNFANFFVKRNCCRIHFWYMSKDEAIDLWRNSDPTDKSKN